MFHERPDFVGPRPLERRSNRPRRHQLGKAGGAASLTRKLSNGDRDLLIRDYLEHLGSPRALTIWLLYSSGDHRQLVEQTCDPLHYTSAESFKRDHAATKFLSKYVGLKTGIDLKGVAIATAEEAEARCLETNRRIRRIRAGIELPGQQNAVWYRAQAKISEILGPCPRFFGGELRVEPSGPFSYIPFFRDVGWSKGRTTSCWGDELSSVHKYTGSPDVTVSARKFALELLRDSPQWTASVLDAQGPCSPTERSVNLVAGNVMLTVPKSAKTDRVICYEPHMNIRLQLMVGGHIRRRLQRWGVDLSDQSLNQRRAVRGSATGLLATIDLRSASDTLSRELVWELLPFDWACLLNDLRSWYTTWPDGSVRFNEKFSSMGNGFTFELESLIFFALCSAVSDDVTVYGDDIILPAKNFSLAKEALEYAGFAVNSAKSFDDGPFRESCGKDAYCGFSVTPVYLKRPLGTLEEVVKLHNQVRAWALQDDRLAGDSRVRLLLERWRRLFPCLLGPSGQGDGHFHVEFQDLCPQRARDWVDGWWFNTWVRRFEDHMWGSDFEGRWIPARYGFAALCAAVGPKPLRNTYSAGLSLSLIHI